MVCMGADRGCRLRRATDTVRTSPIEYPDQVEHHRWIPPAATTQRGLVPLDGDTRALLHRLRWREPPRDRRRLWSALALTLLLHALFGALTWYEMRPHALPTAPVQAYDVLQVRLIDNAPAASPAAPPPPPALPPPHAAVAPKTPPPPRVAREPVDKHAMTVALPAPKPPPKLYQADGELRVPPPAAASTAPPAYVAGILQGGDKQVLRHDAGDKYRSKDTRFAPYFPPPGESSVDTAIRKVVEKTTKTGTVHLPKGVRIHCSTVLFILPVGCGGDPPAPPPSNDGDERLSMAPAPLTKSPHAPKPPSVDQCIAIYRASKPLPYGCPVDTPSRAVDAEMRERARRSSGH